MKKKIKINPNKIIDDIFHPLFHESKAFVFIDGTLHFIVENDPPKSIKKFIRYSLKHLI